MYSESATPCDQLDHKDQDDFNYEDLDSETRIVVEQRTSEIKSLVKRNAQDVCDIGQKLFEVKGKLGHGGFTNWLKSEFSWSISAATRFMQVAERFKFINLTNLNIAASALYLLASPSTSEEACDEALALAREGKTITHGKVNGIVKKHKLKSVTINAPAETVELVSSSPAVVSEATHVWEDDIRDDSGNSIFEGEYPEPNLRDSDFGDDPLLEVGVAEPNHSQVFHSNEESFQPLDIDVEVGTSAQERDRLRMSESIPNGSEYANLTSGHNGLANSEVSFDSEDRELSASAVNSLFACMREIDLLNTTFPKGGFYLGIQPDGFSKLLENAHPLKNLLSVNYLREAVALVKKAMCSIEGKATDAH